MKTKTEDNKGTTAEGMYKITIGYNDGSREIVRHTQILDTYGLTRAVDKCEIKYFRVELDD